ncbi:hypothetical protein BG005_010107, partial [Podila minutissima]
MKFTLPTIAVVLAIIQAALAKPVILHTTTTTYYNPGVASCTFPEPGTSTPPVSPPSSARPPKSRKPPKSSKLPKAVPPPPPA